MKKKNKESLLTKLKRLFHNIKENYNKMTKTAKTLLWLWIVIALVIIIIIIICSSNNRITSSHLKIEEAMTDAAERYAEENDLHGSKEQKLRIDLYELLDSKYLKKKDLTDDTCRGYSTYYSEFDKDGLENIKIKSYLSCKKYTTEGYKNS